MVHDHDTESSTSSKAPDNCQNPRDLPGCFRRASGGAPGSGGGEAASLEPKENTVTNHIPNGDRVLLRHRRCRSRFCPKCGMSRGIQLRDAMSRVSDLFPRPVLLTLTVDRAGTKTGRGFDGPEAAYDYVRDGRYLPRLLRLIGVKRWVSVLEFQSGTGDGWPHWHILCDGSHWPRGRMPKKLMEKLWKLWRDKWGVGSVDVSEDKLCGSVHACRYITKYLTKPPKRGWPRWVLERHNVRIVSTSREVGALVGDSIRRESTEPTEEQEPVHRRPASKVVSSCCHSTLVFRERMEEEIDHETGEVVEVKRLRYLGEVSGRLGRLYELSQTINKGHDGPVVISKEEVPRWGYVTEEYTVNGGVGLLQALAEETGEAEAARESQAQREQELLLCWENRKRA
jgi:hypothetical protein